MSILFYDDSPVFGGHEVMSLAGVEAVLSSGGTRVDFVLTESNSVLRERVSKLADRFPNLRAHPVPWCSSKLEALRNRVTPSRIRTLSAALRDLNPSLVVAIQGNIEHSSLALHASRAAGIRCASYIPVPHSNAKMGAKLGSIRDWFCRDLFLLPDDFVTISDEMAALLRERGARAPIHIVYNGIDTERFKQGDTVNARRSLDLPHDKILVGVIGRVEFRQKQQHLLVEALAGDPALQSSCHLVFAGEGPDRANLAEIVSRLGVSATILPWCDPALVYQAIDALVIPSRYEGLPLVMLEALASGTTVLGSDRDGMKDLLPAERRFEPDNPAAIRTVLQRFIQEGKPPASEALVARVRETMSMSAFRQAFSSTLLSLRGPDSRLQCA